MTDLAEIKQLAEQTNNLLPQLRATADEALAEAKKFGQSDALTQEKLGRIETDMAGIIQKMTDIQRKSALGGEPEQKDRLTEQQLEAKAAQLKLIRAGMNIDALSDGERKALNTLSNPDGGFLTSADISGRMVKRIYDASPVRRYAGVQTTSKGVLTGIVNNGRGSYGWIGELDTRAETNTQQFGEYEVRVHELYSYPKVSTSMLDDADYDIESLIINDGAMGFAEGEAQAFIKGNGVKKPRGFMAQTFATTDDNTRAWGTVQKFKTGADGAFAAAPNSGDILIDMATSLRAGYQTNAAWMMNRFSLARVMKLKNSDGDYLWMPNFQIAGGAFGTLLGRPVDASFDHMDSFGTGAFPIAYGDLGQAYLIVDRRGISIIRDNLTAPGFVKMHMSKRVGGDVINSEAYRVLETSA